MLKNFFQIFISIILLVFVVFFGMTTYRYYQAIHSDDPVDPYLLVESGSATIARGDLAIDMISSEQYGVEEGDIIITRADSIALIMWPDHSTTRLGPLSRMVIETMRVADDYSRIELIAALESGKAWSNIVRTLYPDSRVEMKIPKNGVVAGVRGTIFEVNLDANYIQSIDHSVMLKNLLGMTVTLLPGDAVLANNILQKAGHLIDSAWISFNTGKDEIYNTVRTTSLRQAYVLLSGDAEIPETWDAFVRWILSYIPSFEDISFFDSLSTKQLPDMVQNTLLLKWYQAFQSKDFIQERDLMRGRILQMKMNFQNGEQLIDSFIRGALWDISSSSGVALESARSLLQIASQNALYGPDMLLNELKNIGTQQLSEPGKRLYEQLMK